jgi:TetR/AcrR family transcriptional regulator
MPEPEINAPSGALLSRVKQGRERILAAIREAAIAEFSRHGFKGASTKAIAERAGLTKPQLHYYISSKEELYEELLYSVLNGWSGAFIFDSDSDDPKKVLSNYVRKKLDYALDNPGLSRIFTTEVLGGGRREVHSAEGGSDRPLDRRRPHACCGCEGPAHADLGHDAALRRLRRASAHHAGSGAR